MAAATAGRVALFSIHPLYAEAILGGGKTVEFRRQSPASDVTHIMIYATSPRQRVVGLCSVAWIEQMSPKRAWTKYRTVGGITKPAFDQYYEGAPAAYVIHLSDPILFPDPVRLSSVDPLLRPPQSFVYLNEDQVAEALNAAGVSHPDGCAWSRSQARVPALN